MSKAVLSSSMNLAISVIIIIFVVSVGFFEINQFLTLRNNQLFYSDVLNIIENINYLTSSNNRGGFLQTILRLPNNQSLIFDNSSNVLVMNGSRNETINLSIDLVNLLELNEQGNYEITICYECSVQKDYLVIIR
jgi:hypothetical protein